MKTKWYFAYGDGLILWPWVNTRAGEWGQYRISLGEEITSGYQPQEKNDEV